MVDEDQKDKALAITSREPAGMGGQNFLMVSKYAGKAHREEFLDYINRTYPEFFEENDDHDAILKAINAKADEDLKNFIAKTCGEYVMPCLEFAINAPDL